MLSPPSDPAWESLGSGMHLISVPQYNTPMMNLMGKFNSLLVADYTEQWEGTGQVEGTVLGEAQSGKQEVGRDAAHLDLQESK